MDQICADPVAFEQNVNENIRRNGEKVWIAWTNKVYLDDQGRVEGILSIGTDITERKRMEEALRTSEERMHLFFERQIVGLAITSPEKGWLQVNDRLCEMLGYPRKELVCRTWVELTHPDDIEQDVVELNRLLAGDIDGYSLDKRFLRKDGTIVWGSLSIGCVRRPNGSVDYVLALLVDITERKKAEEKAKLSATLIHYLSKYANDFIILLDENFCFLEVNERVVDFYGYTREELIGMHASQLRAPETNEEFIKQMKVVQVSDKALYDTMHQRKDGTKFPVEISLHAIENEGRKFYQAIIRDITERKRTELELRRANRALQTISECNQLLVRAVDETTLLNGICRLLVEQGGFRMAWVGFAEQDDVKSVRPVAEVGFEEGYLKKAAITWADTERGRGPTGMAIRTLRAFDLPEPSH